MTQGLDGQILMMLAAQFDAFKSWIDGQNPLDPQIQDFIRFQIAPAEKCQIDSAGRARIPETLRDHAGLMTPGCEAQIVNMGSLGFEIWSAERYKAVFAERAREIRQTQIALASRSGPAPAPPGA